MSKKQIMLLDLPVELLCQILSHACKGYQDGINMMSICTRLRSMFVDGGPLSKIWAQMRLLGRFHRLQLAQKSDFQAKSSYAKRYSVDLAPPFRLDEVEAFEKQNNVILPRDFRDYIITHSRELLLYSYPTVLKLDRRRLEECDIATGVSYMGPWEKQYRSFTGSTIQISDGICAFFDAMIIKGNRAGSIWEFCDPEYYLSAHSFTHLVEHVLNNFGDRPVDWDSQEWLEKRSPLA